MTRLLGRVDRWLLTPAPASRLAALRILVGGFTTVYLIVRLPFLLDLTHLTATRFDPVGVLGWLNEPLPGWFYRGLVLVAIALGLAFSIGWRFRVTGPAFALVALVVLSYRHSWGHLFHTDNLLVLHLAVLALASAADTWSLDARRSARPAPEDDNAAYGWPIRALCLLTVLTYFLAGWAKLHNTGLEWLWSDELRNQVAYDNVRKAVLGDRYSPIGAAAVRHGWIFPPLALLSVAVELGAPLALAGRRIGRAWAVLAWVFHVGVFALMAIMFPYPLTGVAYAAFFPVERLLGPTGIHIAGLCSRGRRTHRKTQMSAHRRSRSGFLRSRRLRLLGASLAAATALMVVTTAAGAQDAGVAASDLRDNDVTFEDGALTQADLDELDREVAGLQDDRAYVKVAVLAEPVSDWDSARQFADALLSELGGAGRVVVFDPDDVGIASNVDTAGEIGPAEDAAAREASDTNSFAAGTTAGVDALGSIDAGGSTQPEGSAGDGGGSGGGFPWFLVIVLGALVIGGILLFRSRSRRRRQMEQVESATLGEAEAKVRSLVDDAANSVLSLTERFDAPDAPPAAKAAFQEGARLFAETQDDLEDADTRAELEAVWPKLVEADWQLDRAAALLAGQPDPPRPPVEPLFPTLAIDLPEPSAQSMPAPRMPRREEPSYRGFDVSPWLTKAAITAMSVLAARGLGGSQRPRERPRRPPASDIDLGGMFGGMFGDGGGGHRGAGPDLGSGYGSPSGSGGGGRRSSGSGQLARTRPKINLGRRGRGMGRR